MLLVLNLSVSMTKVLSQLLGAREPEFRLGLQQMERAGGGTAEDVRLTADIIRERRNCLRELCLDPDDTTGRELFAALMQRVKEDNEAFETLLGAATAPDSAESRSNIMPLVARLIISMPMPKQAFGLKAAAAKRLLRRHPPKRALKQLGYRSIESVLKQEPVALLFAAAAIAETPQWHKAVQAEYRKLSPGDFEQRDVQILAPDAARWEKISQAYVAHHKHNILSFRELAAVVLLPLPVRDQSPSHGKVSQAGRILAAPLAATLLVLQAVNDIRTASTYLKLHLVRSDFGSVAASIARHEPLTKAVIAGTVLPWKLVHHYFARYPDAYSPDLFEPHVQSDDLQWHAAEDALADLHPRFAFWQSAAYAGLLEHGEMVSLNLTDAVLSFCNMLPFEQRLVRHARSQLRHELMLRYMRRSGIERAMHDQLNSELISAKSLP